MPVNVKPAASTRPKETYKCQRLDTCALRNSPTAKTKHPATVILRAPKRSRREPASGDKSASMVSTAAKIPAMAPRLQPKVSSKATLKTPKDEWRPREKPSTTNASAAIVQGVGANGMTLS